MRMRQPDERQAARERAKAHTIRRYSPDYPREPKIEDFEVKRIQKYPALATYLQYGILLTVLLFGFIPSAMRVFSYGAELFSHVIANPWASGLAGVSLVIMAEASIVGFNLARLFTPEGQNKRWLSSRTLFIAGMIAATAIALVFNIEVTVVRTNAQNGIFGLTWAGWLEALFPPVFVLIGAHGLVEIFLTQMEDNQRQNAAFEQAHHDWRQDVRQIQQQFADFKRNLEDEAVFQTAYRLELRHALRETNKNLGLANMDKIPDKLWARLIAREIRAEHKLNDEIDALLEAQAEPLARQTDALEAAPENFSNGS